MSIDTKIMPFGEVLIGYQNSPCPTRFCPSSQIQNYDSIALRANNMCYLDAKPRKDLKGIIMQKLYSSQSNDDNNVNNNIL